ncbi:Imm50 family immunity protein [Spirosoma flavum]|uniref:Imm50 family immunity protein n=1 Tax=Spirosoma flavum TaxID=2048557 RepID=A0ABW6ALS6_9BACT
MWYEVAMNPKAVSSIFTGDEPCLEKIEVSKIIMSYDGPSFTIIFDVKNYPMNPPEKWKQYSYNQAQIALQLWDVKDVKIEGWSTINIADISFLQLEPQKFLFKLIGSGCAMTMQFQRMQVEVTGYMNKTH